MDMHNIRLNLEESSRRLADLKTDVEMGRKAVTGQVPSEDLII